jgi:CheY-like chemotaxis protein
MISKTITRTLVVENEAIIAEDICDSLRRLGYGSTEIASSGESAVEAAARWRPNIVLMDIKLKGKMDGIEAATQICRQAPVPIIYLTADADETTISRARATKPFGFLRKPYDAKELHATIEMALSTIVNGSTESAPS